MSIRKINLKDNRLFYEDFSAGLQYLNNVNFDDYEYPKERMKFHVYTEAKTEKQLESIKSYLATQDLDKTELIVWCDYDITNQANMQPYKDLVTIKVYNPIGLDTDGYNWKDEKLVAPSSILVATNI